MMDLALLLLRLTLGGFFVLARARTLFYHDRILSLERKLGECGLGARRWLTWLVALVEVLAGLGLITGFLTRLSALGLAVVLIVAMRCVAREKIARQRPNDSWDVCTCCLWLVEPLYLIMALAIALAGGGALSLDALIW